MVFIPSIVCCSTLCLVFTFNLGGNKKTKTSFGVKSQYVSRMSQIKTQAQNVSQARKSPAKQTNRKKKPYGAKRAASHKYVFQV